MTRRPYETSDLYYRFGVILWFLLQLLSVADVVTDVVTDVVVVVVVVVVVAWDEIEGLLLGWPRMLRMDHIGQSRLETKLDASVLTLKQRPLKFDNSILHRKRLEQSTSVLLLIDSSYYYIFLGRLL